MKDFTVGVFPMDCKPGRKQRYTAYTVGYRPNWPGCCVHIVSANNGTDAKKVAIFDHKEKCAQKKETSQ